MKKIDLKKEYKQLFTAKSAPAIVDVPPLNYLMVDGIGDPGTAQSFKEAVGTLYSVAYGLRFRYKREKEIEYGVMPLQALWWADDMADFIAGNRDSWRWTVMLLQPEFISRKEALDMAASIKKKSAFDRFPEVRFERFDEGRVAQVLHVGPYSAERPTIEKLHAFIREQGHALSGKHHEIYLGDPRKAAPEKLKTIIRQPVVKA